MDLTISGCSYLQASFVHLLGHWWLVGARARALMHSSSRNTKPCRLPKQPAARTSSKAAATSVLAAAPQSYPLVA
jgi:hypothetical protein